MSADARLAAELHRLRLADNVNEEEEEYPPKGVVLGSCVHGAFVMSSSGRVHRIAWTEEKSVVPWAGEAWPMSPSRIATSPPPPSGHHRLSQIDKQHARPCWHRAAARSARFAGAALPFLDDDTMHIVVRFLPDEVSILRASCVCRGWFNVSMQAALWKPVFLRKVECLIMSASACAAIAHAGKLPHRDVGIFVRAATLTNAASFGDLIRALSEHHPGSEWLHEWFALVTALKARKAMVVARLYGFLRVYFSSRRVASDDDYNLYTKLLFRRPRESDVMEDVAPLALAARAIAFSEVYLTHEMFGNLKEMVGVDGVAGMTFIYAKLGSDAARPLRTAPVDVFPIQLFTFAQHGQCCGGALEQACGLLRRCSMRNILRHGQFVDLARKLLTKLDEKARPEASDTRPPEENAEVAFAFDFCDYSEKAPDEVRDLVHATANKNWPRFEEGRRRAVGR